MDTNDSALVPATGTATTTKTRPASSQDLYRRSYRVILFLPPTEDWITSPRLLRHLFRPNAPRWYFGVVIFISTQSGTGIVAVNTDINNFIDLPPIVAPTEFRTSLGVYGATSAASSASNSIAGIRALPFYQQLDFLPSPPTPPTYARRATLWPDFRELPQPSIQSVGFRVLIQKSSPPNVVPTSLQLSVVVIYGLAQVERLSVPTPTALSNYPYHRR
ncbi:hypothetical protein GALMADRAFT_146646 [Galerina marginata CBS 339.88]|uniref:Uncharacterized protein n=1 Tax=Galerina marginata (strain CBS 339.88) TaxID=685588 RepID=A0A067SKB2_GALM3|nr:hypothetical protein GALMADRAFT_146646 [Galerina marginata CBS 339.88]